MAASPRPLTQAAPTIRSRPLGVQIDQMLGRTIEIVTALLVAAEVVILFVGIVARYVFHSPLIWSDELASALFLWLAMLGSVVALRLGGHMRMTAFVIRASPSRRPFFELLGLLGAIGFFVAILPAAIDHAENEAMVSIMSLDISMAWRAAAMPVGVALLIITALLRLTNRPPAQLIPALLLTVAAFGVFYALHPLLPGLGRANLLIFFVGVVSATVFAGIPIAISFGLATLGYLALSTRVPISVLVARMDTGMSHPILLSVPLFVFLGLLIEMTGINTADTASFREGLRTGGFYKEWREKPGEEPFAILEKYAGKLG
jgi:TRAP-type C4-dicarboxylate transport system permease small subunit